MFFKNQLATITMKEGAPIAKHIQALKALLERFSINGAPCKDEEAKLILMRSLPPSWLPIIAPLRMDTKNRFLHL